MQICSVFISIYLIAVVLALPLGELSSQVTERVLSFGRGSVCPLRPRCARPPLPEGEARGIAQYPLTIRSIGIHSASNLSVSSMSFSISGHILPLFMLTCYVKRRSPLALPLGELSPQVTERALSFGRGVVCPLRPRCARPPLPEGEARGLVQYALMIRSIGIHSASNLSVSSMSFSISGHILPLFVLTYYVKRRSPLALPLGELSPQVTERALSFGRGVVCPLRPRCARPPLSEGEARGIAQYALMIRQIGICL